MQVTFDVEAESIELAPDSSSSVIIIPQLAVIARLVPRHHLSSRVPVVTLHVERHTVQTTDDQKVLLHPSTTACNQYCYVCQARNVMSFVCLSVCLSVCLLATSVKLLNGSSRKHHRCICGQERTD